MGLVEKYLLFLSRATATRKMLPEDLPTVQEGDITHPMRPSPQVTNRTSGLSELIILIKR